MAIYLIAGAAAKLVVYFIFNDKLIVSETD